MPKEVFGRDYQFLEREKLLSFEEIARLTRLFASLGVEKIRQPAALGAMREVRAVGVTG